MASSVSSVGQPRHPLALGPERLLQVLPEPRRADHRLLDLHRDDAQPQALVAAAPALGHVAQPRRQLLDDRLLVGEHRVDAHRRDLVLDGRLGLLAQLHVDHPHRVLGVGEVELLVGGGEVLDDPLHVALHQQALQLAADAVRVDEDGLHGARHDQERVRRRVEAEGDAQADVQRLGVAAAGVDDVGVGRHHDRLPPPEAGDAHVHGVARNLARGRGEGPGRSRCHLGLLDRHHGLACLQVHLEALLLLADLIQVLVPHRLVVHRHRGPLAPEGRRPSARRTRR